MPLLAQLVGLGENPEGLAPRCCAHSLRYDEGARRLWATSVRNGDWCTRCTLSK